MAGQFDSNHCDYLGAPQSAIDTLAETENDKRLAAVHKFTTSVLGVASILGTESILNNVDMAALSTSLADCESAINEMKETFGIADGNGHGDSAKIF